ncbi:hypothetical protein JCM33374_g4224 [Metschnikowia sp. JCM 33374]|nr:hypothetical protein JCM33374_g4224 [Metschnikowia sp. JCM 33374]
MRILLVFFVISCFSAHVLWPVLSGGEEVIPTSVGDAKRLNQERLNQERLNQVLFSSQDSKSNGKRRFRSPKTREAENLIEEVFSKMQQFTRTVPFNATGFRLLEEEIAHQLMNIENFIHSHGIPIENLVKKLAFLDYVYQQLVAAVRDLQIYKFNGTTAEFLVYTMIDLNARLLWMFDSSGNLDKNISQYAHKLISFGHSMNRISEDFQALSGLSQYTKWLFTGEKRKAQENIEFLWDQVPKSQRNVV